jgi:hypothetical protein
VLKHFQERMPYVCRMYPPSNRSVGGQSFSRLPKCRLAPARFTIRYLTLLGLDANKRNTDIAAAFLYERVMCIGNCVLACI